MWSIINLLAGHQNQITNRIKMKIKIKDKKKLIPMWGSYCGLSTGDWEELNAGKEVEVDSIPPAAEEYVTETKKKETK